MNAICPQCQAKLKIADEKVKPEGVRVKCPRCQAVLRVKKPAPVAASAAAGKSGPPAGEKAAAGGKGEKGVPPRSRRYKRYPYHEKIMVDNAILVNGIDISEGGLFVHTGRSFIVGSEVSVSLPLPDGRLKVRATVQHNEPGVGMGLQFCELPASARARLKKFFAQETSMEESASLDSRKRVLLAGGSEVNRRIAKSKLVLEGYAVVEAIDTGDVFRKMTAQVPDVILIDWQDKKLDGEELLRKLKQKPDWRRIIKIVLSAVSNEVMQEKIMAAGADEFLAKMDTPPVRLADRIKQIIESR